MYNCKFCGSNDIRVVGHPCKDRMGIEYQKTQCNGCGRFPSFRITPRESEIKTPADKPARSAKILLIDIETLPLRGFAWGLIKQNIGINQIISTTKMLSWSAKWLFEEEIYSDILTPEECIAQNDKRICQSIWKFMDDADIIIAHNGQKFDIPKINYRFVVNELPPPSYYRVIDTLKPFQKGGRLFPDSGRLNHLCAELGIGEKIDTGGFELWEKCFYGDQEALNEMLVYNKHDVFLLEGLYLKVRSWINSHPNVGLFIGDNVSSCGICGSSDIEWLDGHPYQTAVGLYSTFRCNDCKSLGKSRETELSLQKRKSLVANIAR